MNRILVIKLGAFGDFVQSFHAFAAIRTHHRDCHVALLTTAPYEMFGQAPWFDEVVIDERAPRWNIAANRRTIQAINRFDFIYDLQTSRRSSRYFAHSAQPPWSGIAPACSHPHANPRRDRMHTLERQREQLLMAGISATPTPDREWLVARGHMHGVKEHYGLIVPGCAGPAAKRWPVEGYVRVARALIERGIQPVVIGRQDEFELARTIMISAPGALDLTGHTSIADLAALGARASLVVGNDTGPVHLAALMGAATIVLFSGIGIPEQASPRGPTGEWPTVLRATSLRELSPERVILAIEQLEHHALRWNHLSA